MSVDPIAEIWPRITLRRAALLAQLADMRTERECAEALGLSLSGVRSAVEVLRAITGQASTRDLGRWWRVNAPAYVSYVAVLAGVDSHAMTEEKGTEGREN